MKPRLAILLLLSGLACDADSPAPEPIPGPYLANTSPENVLENLETAYRLRDPEEYAQLLHSDFVFVFQQADVQEVGTEFWTRDQDTTQTRHLFEAMEVTRIAIELTHSPATPSSAGEDTMFIRVNPTQLEVDELVDGITTTYQVDGDIQDMYFVRGTGADRQRWYLHTWIDKPGGGGFGLSSLAIGGSTWGRIKSQYR